MKRKAGEIFIRRTGNKGPIWQQEKNLWQDKQGINWREWWMIEKLKKNNFNRKVDLHKQ